MPTVEVNKADVLRAISTERDWWSAAIGLAEQGGPLTGDEAVNGTLALRDLIAHVNGWRAWTVLRLEAAADDAALPAPPWPASLSDATEEGTDEINAWFLEQGRTKPLNVTIAEAFALLDRMQVAVERIPEDRLLTPGSFAAMDRALATYPIGPALVGFSITHVHGEHALDLVPWLTARNGQHPDLPPTPSNLGFED